MDDIRIELDCGVEEAKRLLAEHAVTGFWPKLKAAWHRVPGPTDWRASPSYAIRLGEDNRFILENILFAGRDRKAFSRMLESIFAEHVASPAESGASVDPAEREEDEWREWAASH